MNLYEKQAVSAEEKHQIDDEKQEVEGGNAAVSYSDSYKSPLLTTSGFQTSTCTICGERIQKSYFHWLSLENPVFPQYCHDTYQNKSGSQKHIPKKD